jgi:multidrug resistance efflux pump
MKNDLIFHHTRKQSKGAGVCMCFIATFAITLLSGCNSPGGNPPTAQSTETSRLPQTAEVTKRDITEQIPVDGNLVVPPPAQASVSEPFKSPVERVYKGVGDYVKRGEPIVELDIPTTEAYREQASLNLQQALAEYKSAKSVWDPRLSSAKIALQTAENTVIQAKKAQKATTVDPDTGAMIPASEVETTAPDLTQAMEQRKQAEQELAQIRTEMRQELEPYNSRIAEARAALKQARANDNAGLIKSPIEGVLTTLNAQPGQEVDGNQSTPIAVVVNLDGLQIHAPMAPNYASHVKENMEAVVTFDEVPGKEFRGRVKQITTRNNGQEYVAILTFSNTGYEVKPGYHPHVGFRTGRHVENQPAVPAEAVDYENKQWFVQVRRNETWEKVTVTPGVSDGKFTSIEAGVKPGDIVLVTPGS